MNMGWVYLIGAGILEIVWAVGLKYTQGWTKLWPSLGTGGAMVIGFILLSQALKTIPIGTAYAVWTGIGAVGTAVAGMILFSEPRDVARVGCILLVVIGIVGLKFTS
jgi:quaternary ammonium compound-resistance protein SugE